MALNLKELEDLFQSSLSVEKNIVSSKQKSVNKNKCRVSIFLEVLLEDGITLPLFVKLAPITKTLDEQHTLLQREINFYNISLPTLKFFQEKEQIDELYFFPLSYGGKNLNNNKDPFLVLEDLQSRGYKNSQNFDLGTTRQILKDLASLHAIPLALKIKDPKVFDTKIKRHLNQETVSQISPQTETKLLKMLEDDLVFSECLDKIKEKFEDVPDKGLRVPFSTMIHGSCFWKHFMVKTNSDGSVDVKLIDFQLCSYGSLSEDLIYFLYTSVPIEILEEHSDSLIAFYHSNFVRVIEECKCDPTPFSLEALQKEIKIVVNESQLIHILCTLFSNLEITTAKERILFVVEDFIKREWL